MDGKALSVRQPWANLIVCGLKAIEIRSWSTNYRGPLFIHAGKTIDQEGIARFRLQNPPTGSLIGTVELVKVEPFEASTWDQLADLHLANAPFVPGLFGWHLENPQPLPKPIAYEGKLNLFPVEIPTDQAEEEAVAQGYLY